MWQKRLFRYQAPGRMCAQRFGEAEEKERRDAKAWISDPATPKFKLWSP